MRLIGGFETEKQAYNFYSFLLQEGIQNIYDVGLDEVTKEKQYRIWVYDEDDLEKALDWIERFKKNPHDPQFQNLEVPLATVPPPPDYVQISKSEELKWQPPIQSLQPQKRQFSFTLTHLIIILCGFLFIWDDFQEAKILKEQGPIGVQIALTPLCKMLMFDQPDSYKYIEQALQQFPFKSYQEEKEIPAFAQALVKKANEVLSWRGIYDYFMTAKAYGWECAREIPMFEKIRQGQVWRLFTPCVLHRDFLHILFNMVWVWILLKQIEERLSKYKLCLLILVIGIISNLAQYLMSGPYFLGFSGVIVGLAGFIWVRQKKAPWEGYPLQRGTLLFLLFFVLAMFLLEILTFSLHLLSIIKITPSIANTAHIVGGITGILLGRLSFFSRRFS